MPKTLFHSNFFEKKCELSHMQGGRDAPAHIVMTYSALCTLLSLGDDLSRVHLKDVVQSVRAQSTGNQQDNR